jgi:Domain of unknown function (DUF4111)
MRSASHRLTPLVTRNRYPTPFASANAVIDAVHAGARAVLGERCAGMLVLGSLATGGYDPARSDVDFLVITSDTVTVTEFQALGRMHADLRTSGLPGAQNIEGAYIPLSNLREYRATDAHPWLGSDGHFAWETQNSDWIIQRHIAREGGVIVSGPDPRMLIDPVSPDALKQATRALLREWWAWQADDPRNLVDDEYQAYAVLTMCRARYTLDTGEIASKPVAARWMIDHDARWTDLIQSALARRPGMRMAALNETVTMLRAVVAAA